MAGADVRVGNCKYLLNQQTLIRLSEKNLVKPFSCSKIEEFVSQHEKIYIFGHGKYGRELEKYFQYRGWKIEKFVVSNAQSENEISYNEFKMEENSGMVVALGGKAFKKVGKSLIDNYDNANLLLPLV